MNPECGDEALQRGTVFVDCEAALEESGELLGEFGRGVLKRGDVEGRLVDLSNLCFHDGDQTHPLEDLLPVFPRLSIPLENGSWVLMWVDVENLAYHVVRVCLQSDLYHFEEVFMWNQQEILKTIMIQLGAKDLNLLVNIVIMVDRRR
ncbi:hypothetical protein QJS10_CPB04g00774 [Acorus calamus]|uniref:Uncharacterized protein n=1 Tax=Acorus calamus TaxID=4465 RepID=A0AAV9F0A6_ACOCL|nr:hypothetical protein QJS10_CPB04g00774 [Acorus calamus]